MRRKLAKSFACVLVGISLAPVLGVSQCFAQPHKAKAPAWEPASTRWCKTPSTVQELRIFLERAKREHRIYQLSLRRLAAEVAAAQRADTSPPDLLHGLNWFFGAVVLGQADDGDVILLGSHDPTMSLDVDALATAIQLVASGHDHATLAIVPDKEPDYRRTVVEGIPRKSGIAERMLEAATTVESLAFGAMRDNTVRSYSQRLARAKRPRGQTPPSNKVSWVLTRSHEDRPRSIILSGGDGDSRVEMLLMTSNPVVLQAEREPRGIPVSQAPRREAALFASEFTAKLNGLERKHKPLADLCAWFRVVDLLAHVHRVGKASIPGQDFWTDVFHTAADGPPERIEVPGESTSSDYSLPFEGSHRPRGLVLRTSVRVPVSLNTHVIPTVSAGDVIRRVLEDVQVSPRLSQNATSNNKLGTNLQPH